MKPNKSVLFSLALIALALAVIAFSMQLKSLFLSQSGDIGPKAFPIGAAVALIACAVGKMLTEGRSEQKAYFTREGWKRVFLMFALLVMYLISMYYIGYMISTLVFTPLFVVVMREGRKLNVFVLIAFSLVVTAVLYFVFEYVVMVSLPTGELFYYWGEGI